jgi:hypothetical protein
MTLDEVAPTRNCLSTVKFREGESVDGEEGGVEEARR